MEDRLCFINSGQLLVMDGEGQQLSAAALPAAEMKLRLSAGGQIYAVAGSPEGSSFSPQPGAMRYPLLFTWISAMRSSSSPV